MIGYGHEACLIDGTRPSSGDRGRHGNRVRASIVHAPFGHPSSRASRDCHSRISPARHDRAAPSARWLRRVEPSPPRPGQVCRRREQSGTICLSLSRRGDQLIVLSSAPALDLRAMERDRPGGVPLFGQGAQDHNPRCQAATNDRATRRVHSRVQRARGEARLLPGTASAKLDLRCGRVGELLHRLSGTLDRTNRV